jgi:hypothetical protein
MLSVLCLAAIFPTASAYAAIAVDTNVSLDQNSAKTTVVSPVFSTTSGNELLLAFVTADYISGANTVVSSLSGGELTWDLVVRTNAQSGTSEIWRALATSPISQATVTATLSHSVVASITVLSFTGANVSGTNGSGAVGATKSASSSKGAPSATLVTTQNGSWVFGVGNDYDSAILRVPGSGQSAVHQDLTSTGDTYWVQMQNSPTALSGTTVSINDTAPTGDRYNLSIVEVLAATAGGGTASTISGTLSPSPLLSGSSLTLTLPGGGTATTTPDASGNYSFGNLSNGSYTVTPSKAGQTFTPASQNVTIAGSNVIGVNFAMQTWSISGNLGAVSSGSTVTLSGSASASTTANASGNYSFGSLANGSYSVTPSKAGQTFSPASQNVTVAGSNVTGVNFAQQTWSISGNVGTTTSGTTVTLSGSAGASTTADASGNYGFNNLLNGSYTVTPANAGFAFNPPNQPVTLNGANASHVSFTATPNPTWSISGTISPASLGANVPLALSGSATANTTTDSNGNFTFSNLQNGNYTVTPSQAGEQFTPASQTTSINGASVGNLNFSAQTVTAQSLAIDANVSADATAKANTAVSPVFSTNSANELLLAFVTADFLSGTNTSVTGITGAGLTWALVQRSNAQSGTAEIWRAFAPSPLSSVKVTAALSQSVQSSITIMTFAGVDTTGTNGSGAIGQSVAANARSGAPTATLLTTRNNSWVFGVGNDFDNAVVRTLGPNQTLVHQDLTSAGDTYWVQRQTNPTPVSGTSVTINDTKPTTDRYNLAVVEVLPSSTGGGVGGGTPPTISVASPLQFATVTGTTTIIANVSNTGSNITGVQFLLDQANLGSQVRSAPYSIAWDTTTATAGTHTLSAIAYNSADLSATATPITVTVDNSGNAAVVGTWSQPVSLPAVAVNLMLMKNNSLLFYQDGTTPTVWDYVNNVFTSVPAPADLFCSGQTQLADGRILIVGGFGGSSDKYGIADAEIFDPSSNTWTTLPKMKYPRWYPSATTLSDGKVLVTGGWKTTEHSNAGIPEVYDPVANTWTQLTNANNPFETYPFIYMLSDGRLIHVNGSEYATVTDILNLNTQSWSTVDANITEGGSSVMYLPDKIMKAGSAADSQMTGPSANTTFVLDMTQPSPKWQQTASMAHARSFMNLTELPDGTVLATGGETDKNGGDVSKAVYAAELWSPTTMTWTSMSAMHTPREYHGTALLLPDGRVLESGMGADFGNVPDQLNAEFFSPPYLFKGPRPSITQAPSQINYGQNFTVATPDAASIKTAVLMGLGEPTHFFNMTARYVPLTFTQTSGGLTLTAPANGYVVPPGYYMLFLVNSNGVPAIAPFVHIQ